MHATTSYVLLVDEFNWQVIVLGLVVWWYPLIDEVFVITQRQVSIHPTEGTPSSLPLNTWICFAENLGFRTYIVAIMHWLGAWVAPLVAELFLWRGRIVL